LIDHGAFNPEPAVGAHARMPAAPLPERAPLRIQPRVADRPVPSRAAEPFADDLRARLLETSALLLDGAADDRVALLFLLNLRMRGCCRRDQRAGSE
jgi:hypothetical protein